MRPEAALAEAPAEAPVEARVLREQVAALYGTALSSTLADTAIAWGLCALLWWQRRDPMVLVWLALHVAQLLRYPLLGAYFRDPHAAERSAFWARRQWRELLCYSATWGLAPWLMMPRGDMPLTALLMIVMLGLVSGGVPSVAPRWASVLAFVLPMTAGLVTALLWAGDATHVFLALCCLIHLGATLHFARNQHLLLTASLRMRFEKEALAEALARQVAISERASAEKTRFFAAASHDLRQPLHAIGLFGAVIERELAACAHPQHANTQRLMRAVDALGDSLDTLLDVSRLDAGVIAPELAARPLNPVLQALGAIFTPRADERGLQLRLRATPLWARTDAELLQRLLANLIENALKYTPQGGVLVLARARGAQVWIDVVDTGIGIAPEHQEAVFAEFYQVGNPRRDRSRGLGMGLSIVRRLSLLLDHPVHLHSRPGHGSRFRVVLPAAAAQSTPVRPNAAAPAATPSGARVLLVEDEDDIAHAMQALLHAQGLRLARAATPAEARQRFDEARAAGQPFDALVCDLRLAGGADGLALALSLRGPGRAALPTLLITGETAPDPLRRVRDAGLPVLFKPVAAPALLDALARAMHAQGHPQ